MPAALVVEVEVGAVVEEHAEAISTTEAARYVRMGLIESLPRGENNEDS